MLKVTLFENVLSQFSIGCQSLGVKYARLVRFVSRTWQTENMNRGRGSCFSHPYAAGVSNYF